MQVLQLKVTIGNLVMSMIEENSVESLVVAKVRGNNFPGRKYQKWGYSSRIHFW